MRGCPPAPLAKWRLRHSLISREAMADAEENMMVEVLRQRERLAEKVEEARRASVPDAAQLDEPDKPSLVEDGAWDWSRSYDYWRKWAVRGRCCPMRRVR